MNNPLGEEGGGGLYDWDCPLFKLREQGFSIGGVGDICVVMEMPSFALPCWNPRLLLENLSFEMCSASRHYFFMQYLGCPIRIRPAFWLPCLHQAHSSSSAQGMIPCVGSLPCTHQRALFAVSCLNPRV